MLAWTEMDALEMVGNVKIVNVFWRQSQRDLLMDWFCSVEKEPRVTLRPAIQAIGMELPLIAVTTKLLLLPAFSTLLPYLRAQNVLRIRAGLEAMCGRREQSHMPSTVALKVGVGMTGHVCLSRFMSDQKKKKKNHPYGFFQLPEPHLQELFSS